MKRLKKTKRPLILTVNGKAEAVLQDAEAYQRLLDIAAQADAVEGIRQGLEDLKKGRVRPARGSLEMFRRIHEIPLVRLTGRSLRDMEVIYNYVEGDASQHAFAWFNRLAKTIYTLERFPSRGPFIPETRSFAISSSGRNRTTTELFTPWINAIML